jgi:hypothetical protein
MEIMINGVIYPDRLASWQPERWRSTYCDLHEVHCYVGGVQNDLKTRTHCVPTYTETMLTAYEEARREAAKISDREKLATHWLAKVNWFSDRFARASQIETDLETMQIPVPAPLSEASLTLMRIVEACQGHYELHA